MSTHHALKRSSLSSGGLSLKRGKYLYRKPQETFHYISFFFQWVLMPYHEDIYYQFLCCQGSIQLPLKLLGHYGREKSIGTKTSALSGKKEAEKRCWQPIFSLTLSFFKKKYLYYNTNICIPVYCSMH